MSDVDLQIRCQRCGTQMDMRDPSSGTKSLLVMRAIVTRFDRPDAVLGLWFRLYVEWPEP